MSELELCSQCGSGDIGYEDISMRHHCNECSNWSPTNWLAKKEHAAKLWNDANQIDTTVDDIKDKVKELTKDNEQLREAINELVNIGRLSFISPDHLDQISAIANK